MKEEDKFWKDSRDLYMEDIDELSFTENEFFRKLNVIDTSDLSPMGYRKKYAYCLENFGDINIPYMFHYERIIHHEEKAQSLSFLCQ